MPSNVQQNRLSIQLAVSSLARSRFRYVRANADQGTFPHAHIIAAYEGQPYLIGVTCREEIGADGDYNPSYNIVKTAVDLEDAIKIARRRRLEPAFVAIALRRREGVYSAFFGSLEAVEYKRSIPMLPENRSSYKLLIKEYDSRVEDLDNPPKAPAPL